MKNNTEKEQSLYNTINELNVERLLLKENLQKAIESNKWVSVENDPPPDNTIVWGFNKKWIDEDFNPEGVRECHCSEGEWNTAKWDNDQDDYYNENTWVDKKHPYHGLPPTHWMPLPSPPNEK